MGPFGTRREKWTVIAMCYAIEICQCVIDLQMGTFTIIDLSLRDMGTSVLTLLDAALRVVTSLALHDC